MYTRPAQVLLVAVDTAPWSRWLEAAADEVSGWLSLRVEAVGSVAAEVWEWADLVVAVDDDSEEWVHRVGPLLPRRRWRLTREGDGVTAEVAAELRSMAGGMRMLSRLDDCVD